MTPIAAFRAALAAGTTPIGCTIGFSDPLVSDALSSCMDFLWIDLEHSAMSPESLSGHLLAARAAGKPALVRVPSLGTFNTKPILDAGADGIIVPQVRTVEEVRQAVADCRYPPAGTRGFNPRVPSRYGRIPEAEVVSTANREVFVAVMIETREALEAVESIARVPGLDSLVIGPWDLSGAIGTLGDVRNPRMMEAARRVASAARSAGIFVGAGMGALPDFARSMVQLGVQWLQFGGDSGFLVAAADRAVADLRALLAGVRS
jgi:2-keto-3-deoxy-L-rhamnonate aldolase RhmA